MANKIIYGTIILILSILFIIMVSFQPIYADPIELQESKSFSQFNETSLTHLEYDFLNTIWPISKNSSEDNLHLSSTFGPRQKTSENFRYDFHRGLDIPTDYGTPVFAIDDGIVRLASINQTHEQRDDGSIANIYTSTVVQIKHYNTQLNINADKEYYYSTYLHINGSSVVVLANQTVSKGDLIAYVGDDANSNYPHLHFEIREDGLNQDDNTHPLQYLKSKNHDFPRLDTFDNQTSFMTGNKILLNISVTNNDLDWDNLIINGTINGVDFDLYFSLIEKNHATPTADDLDNPIFFETDYKLEISPTRYTVGYDFASYEISIDFSKFLANNGFSDVQSFDLNLYSTDIYMTGSQVSITYNEDPTSSSQNSGNENTKSDESPLNMSLNGIIVSLIVFYSFKVITKRLDQINN